MQAVRHRLRFVTGVSLTARTYGSGLYGDGTYGEQASDPLTAAVYIMVPWPGGYLSDPSWLYREGDVFPPFQVSIEADDAPLDLTGIASAMLVFTSFDGATVSNPVRQLPLTVVTEGGRQWLQRRWDTYDLTPAGTFRVAVVITYASGRRLTVPTDDRHVFVITPNTAFRLGSRWDSARWDESRWTTGGS